MTIWKLIGLIPLLIVGVWFRSFGPRYRQQRGDDETITLFSKQESDR